MSERTSTDLRIFRAEIALNESVSAEVNLEGFTPIRIEMPAEWTAAPISFQVKSDGGAYRNWYSGDGTLNQVPEAGNAEAGKAYSLEPRNFLGAMMIKVVSGIPGTLVNQAAARTVTIVTL